jgi:hypothetical protein
MSRRQGWGGLAWRWVPQQRRSVWLCAVLVAVFATFLIGVVRVNASPTGRPPFGDFFALWSYARIVLHQPAADLYDPALLHQVQVALGMPPGDENPFPYPPTFLLLVWPIGLLPFWAAYLAWIGATLLAALLATCAGAGAGTGARAATAAAMLLAPSTAACLASGQSGFLLAALLVGGLRLAGPRPALAGLLFGLLTYKPQFGLLVPLALVAAGRWRCIAAACVTTAGLVALDTVVLGRGIWAAWWRSLPGYMAVFDRDTAANRTIPTVLGNVQALGVPHGVAQAVQVLAALAAAAAVWAAWRRPGPFAVPALLAATCLATPHAFLYDLPLLSAGALLFAGQRLRTRGALVLPEVAVLAGVLAMPVGMTLQGAPIPLSTITTGLFLALAVAAGREEGKVEALPQTPPKARLWNPILQ